jgi:uncharacterized protein YggE
MKNLKYLAVVALLAGFPLAAQEGSVVASGTGTVHVVGDAATVSLAIESRAAQAGDAGAQNADVVQRVRDAIFALGVDEGAVTTAYYNVRQNWRRRDGDRVPDGYVAEMTLRVELDDLGLAGRVIDAALGAGANRIDGIAFTSSALDQARREALALAVRDAMEAAGTMAAAAGGGLGSLIELTTEGVTRPVPMRAMAADMAYASAAPTEITPDELTVTARVTGRWRFSE